MANIYIHPTANVSEQAKIGDGTKIWINSQIREKSEIGENCIISKDTYIDTEVKIVYLYIMELVSKMMYL
mgnify:CR=1 FL=1